MEILYGYKSYRADLGSSLTIGNFDGFHLGHRKILGAMVESARISGTRSVLISFVPHPLQLLMPERVPKAISSLNEKIRLLRESELDVLAILDFNEALSRMSGEGFVKEIVVQAFRTRHVFVGSDFVFGHQRAGNVALLQRLSRELDFRVHISPQVVVRGSRVSSTRIRHLIHSGQISSANRLLGRYFSLTGTVVPGRGLGAKFLFPTLNLSPGDGLIPQPGVYVTQATFDEQVHPSVTNIGWRPTVAGKDLTVETHLIDACLEKPPAKLSLAFLHRLRDEEKFGSLNQLRQQITRDCQRTRRFFRLLTRLGQPAAQRGLTAPGLETADLTLPEDGEIRATPEGTSQKG